MSHEIARADARDPLHVAAPPTHGGEPPPTGFWSAVREALRGSEQDFTRAPLGRAILLLAVPMVLEMAMESVFAVTDIFFVSRLGPDAMAAVGLTESMLACVYALAMGLAIGATALVARRVGERDPEGASHAGAVAMLMGIGVAAVLGTAGALLAPRLLQAMGGSASVVATGTGYARIMLGGEASIILLFVANAIFRGAGDAAIAMRTLWLANAINIVLGPLLIFGVGPLPRLGVAGAAVATTIGRATGALYAISRLVRGGGRVQVRRAHLRPDLPLMRLLAGMASAATLQTLIGTASWIGLVRIMATFGADALAGYTVAIRVVVFALLPAFGLSNAAATLVGQALGAKDPQRAERAVWRTAHYAAAFLGAVGLLFVVFAPGIVSFFTTQRDVADVAVHCLRLVALGFPLYGYGMTFTAAFNGAGDTRTPTWLNLGVFWAFEIPLAWALAVPAGLGPTGVFLAIVIAFSALTVVSGLLFRRGRWKTQRV